MAHILQLERRIPNKNTFGVILATGFAAGFSSSEDSSELLAAFLTAALWCNNQLADKILKTYHSARFLSYVWHTLAATLTAGFSSSDDSSELLAAFLALETAWWNVERIKLEICLLDRSKSSYELSYRNNDGFSRHCRFLCDWLRLLVWSTKTRSRLVKKL